MADETSLDRVLLDRYIAGELAPTERAQVEAWLQAHPLSDAMVRALPDVALGAAAGIDTDASWRQLHARIQASETTDDLARQRARRATIGATPPLMRLWVRRAGQVAAALILAVGGVGTWRTLVPGGGSVQAPLGRDVTASLPDGTRVILAAGSRLTWQREYGATQRDVVLTGEAHFEVTHDATRPFRVRSRNAVAEDIGTRFVVRAWPELEAVDVAVEEGLVALADTAHARIDRGIVLGAGDRGRLAPTGQVTVTADVDVVTAWTHGQLAFDNQPLAEVLPAIGRRFDVELRADASVINRRLTARFAAQSLTEVLNTLAVSLDVHIVTSGRTITLTSPAR